MRINPGHISFILVNPQTPGNIGSAARAIKTMGFHQLLLVNPGEFKTEEAFCMAHASEKILENAEVYNSLDEAISDKNFVVATTQRGRSSNLPYMTPKEMAEKLVPMSLENKIAIVFGNEKSGLSNDELRRCHAVSKIPAQTTHPSLNLAQAVMIYCYELYNTAFQDIKKYSWKLAKHEDLESLYKYMQISLKRVGFVPIDSWENFTLRFSRLMGRANAEVRDIRVWYKILKSFDNYIDQLEKTLLKIKNENLK
jgi:TrmH family RNA methyltransferase